MVLPELANPLNYILQKLLTPLCFCLCLSGLAQGESVSPGSYKDSVLALMEEVDLDHYLERPAHLFLYRLPVQNRQMRLLPSDRPTYQSMLKVSYGEADYLHIYIYVKRLEHTNANGMNHRKVLREFDRERIGAIHFYDQFVCVKGCD